MPKQKSIVEFRSAIKVARKSQGLYQKEVAGKLNITPKYFSLIEQGTKVPSPKLQEKICTALNIRIRYDVPPPKKTKNECYQKFAVRVR
ncbi:MAG: helix-turn-helix transcriptional regulator [Ignavibacteriae bacterium]|nr:helix-turn-helix transcriptional regulator [Ignavibacteriota bacterium]